MKNLVKQVYPNIKETHFSSTYFQNKAKTKYQVSITISKICKTEKGIEYEKNEILFGNGNTLNKAYEDFYTKYLKINYERNT